MLDNKTLKHRNLYNGVNQGENEAQVRVIRVCAVPGLMRNVVQRPFRSYHDTYFITAYSVLAIARVYSRFTVLLVIMCVILLLT